jgi:biopolymer transport protein ExbB/TolQ
MIDIILNYISNSSIITIAVLVLLSIYFMIVVWIYVYKNMQLNDLIKVEKESLNGLYANYNIDPLSKFGQSINNTSLSKEIFNSYEISFVRDASSGLQWLSIISSTAPFIGLFGTVIGILESFAKFSTQSKVSFSVIAPAISEALVATAGGILVAIFAYTFHLILKRKAYELSSLLSSQSEDILSQVNED